MLLLLPLLLLVLVPFTTMVERATPLLALFRAPPFAPEVAGAAAPLA